MPRVAPAHPRQISSRAENHSLKSLIETFAAKRGQIDRGHIPGFHADGGPGNAGAAGYDTPAAAPAPYAHSGGAMHGAATGVGARQTGFAALGAGMMRPPTGPGPGTAGSAHSGGGPSAEDMDQAFKYLHEFKNFSMRHRIMSNELADTRASVRSLDDKMASTRAAIDTLSNDGEQVKRQIAALQDQLKVIEKHTSEQREALAAHESAKSEAEAKVEMVSTTLEGLARDRDKAKLMVENFAPHLLSEDGAAPTGGVVSLSTPGSSGPTDGRVSSRASSRGGGGAAIAPAPGPAPAAGPPGYYGWGHGLAAPPPPGGAYFYGSPAQGMQGQADASNGYGAPGMYGGATAAAYGGAAGSGTSAGTSGAGGYYGTESASAHHQAAPSYGGYGGADTGHAAAAAAAAAGAGYGVAGYSGAVGAPQSHGAAALRYSYAPSATSDAAAYGSSGGGY